jgi:glyoxylase-like metal-dependent hydrolase (beta-lactamase superfamily II)
VRELAVSKQLHNVEIAEEVLPGLTAYAGPGHTPGHLVYVLNGGERDVIFSGDKVFFGVAVFSGDGDGRWSSKRGRRRCPGCGVVGDGG